MQGNWALRIVLALAAGASACFMALEVAGIGAKGGSVVPSTFLEVQLMLISPACVALCTLGAVAPKRLPSRVVIVLLLASALIDWFWLWLYGTWPAPWQPRGFLMYLRVSIPLYLISSGVTWMARPK